MSSISGENFEPKGFLEHRLANSYVRRMGITGHTHNLSRKNDHY